MKLNNVYELDLPPHRAAQWEIWNKYSGWERARLDGVVEDINEVPRENPYVIEVGAEQGDFPAVWATQGAEVAIIEGNPNFWPVIRDIWDRNISRLPAITACAMVGGTTENIVAYPEGWPPEVNLPYAEDPGFYHLDEHPEAPKTTLNSFISVPAENLYDVIISMDIEGAELIALRGSLEALELYKPIVWVSVHPDILDYRYGQSEDELVGFMKELGYEAEQVAVDHENHWRFA